MDGLPDALWSLPSLHSQRAIVKDTEQPDGLTMRCTGRQQPRLPVHLWYAVQAAVAGELCRYD